MTLLRVYQRFPLLRTWVKVVLAGGHLKGQSKQSSHVGRQSSVIRVVTEKIPHCFLAQSSNFAANSERLWSHLQLTLLSLDYALKKIESLLTDDDVHEFCGL